MRVDFPFDGDLIIVDDTAISGMVRGSVRVLEGTTVVESEGLVLRDVVVESGRVLVHGRVGGDVENLGGVAIVFGSVAGSVLGHPDTTEIDAGARVGSGDDGREAGEAEGAEQVGEKQAVLARRSAPSVEIRFQPTEASPVVVPSVSRLRSRVSDARRAVRLRFWRHDVRRSLAMAIAAGLLLFLTAGGVVAYKLLESPSETSAEVLGRTERQLPAPAVDPITLPPTAPTTTPLAGDAPATAAVRAVLAGLVVDDQPQAGADFEPLAYGWVDADGDCRTTDAEVAAAASATEAVFSFDGCTVVDGSWADEWSGEVIAEVAQLVVEPIVPFENAHLTGAWAWSPLEQFAFANETLPGDLFVVSAATVSARDATNPIEWQAPEASACAYASAWINKKARWSLTVTANEAAMLNRLLDRCGNGDDVFDTLTP